MIFAKEISFCVDNITVSVSTSLSKLVEESTDQVISINSVNFRVSPFVSDLGIFFDEGKRCPIILLENRDYLFDLTFPAGKSLTDNCFPFEKVHISKDRAGYILKFNSRNYVGILNLAVFDILVPVIEIISEKIDYESEYNKLLHKISELGIDLTSRASSNFDASAVIKDDIETDSNILTSQLSYIKSVVLSGELSLYYNEFFRKPLSKITTVDESKYIWEVDNFDFDDYIDGLFSCPVSLHSGDIIPLKLNTCVYSDHIDTIENQFVLFLIENIKETLSRAFAYVSYKKIISLEIELAECLRICNEILSHQIFTSISKLRFLPGKSNVLHRKYPYRELYQIYLMLFFKVKFEDSFTSASMRLPQKDLPKLYEYWCFLNVIEILNMKFGNVDIIKQGLLKYMPETMCYVLNAEGIQLVYEIDAKKKLFVYYNRSYNSDNFIYQGRSYSHLLDPDISLELFIEDKLVGIIHFDAKYSLDKKEKFSHDDLDKMHTYKDAIMGSVGSYILYPGNITGSFIQEEKTQSTLSEWFPSVGAFVFNINDSDFSAERKALNIIIDVFVNIEKYIGNDGIFGSEVKSYDYLKRIIG